jgi:hypothetical protein
MAPEGGIEPHFRTEPRATSAAAPPAEEGGEPPRETALQMARRLVAEGAIDDYDIRICTGIPLTTIEGLRLEHARAQAATHTNQQEMSDALQRR